MTRRKPQRRLPWQPEELEFLRELAGDYPMGYILTSFNKWAVRRGRPRRTYGAIKVAINRKLGLSCFPNGEGEWLTAPDLSRLIRRHTDVVGMWIRKGYFDPEHLRRDNYSYYVCRRGIRCLARVKPYLFKHLDRAELMRVLEDEEVMEFVIESPLTIRRPPKPVRCLNTGRQFPSLSAAAKHLGCTLHDVQHGLKRRIPVRGVQLQEVA